MPVGSERVSLVGGRGLGLPRLDSHVERMIRSGNVVDDDVVHLDSLCDNVGDDTRVERLTASELEEERAATMETRRGQPRVSKE